MENSDLGVVAYLKEVKSKHPVRAEGQKLFQLLLEAIPEAQAKDQLVIVRDGQLHPVPFDALAICVTSTWSNPKP